IELARDFYERLVPAIGRCCVESSWSDLERLVDLHGIHPGTSASTGCWVPLPLRHLLPRDAGAYRAICSAGSTAESKPDPQGAGGQENLSTWHRSFTSISVAPHATEQVAMMKPGRSLLPVVLIGGLALGGTVLVFQQGWSAAPRVVDRTVTPRGPLD